MNLFKVYLALGVLLAVCTYNAEGGIVLLLLLKIIALKGALFIGLPLAIGSFMLGQGVGFIGGSVFGGYHVMNAALKYQKHKQGHGHGWGWKPKGHVHLVVEPHHHHHAHGWGWNSKMSAVAGDGSHSHISFAGPGWDVYPSSPKPSFLGSIRNRIMESIFGTKRTEGHKPPMRMPGWMQPGQSQAYYDTSDEEVVVHHYSGDTFPGRQKPTTGYRSPVSVPGGGGYASASTVYQQSDPYASQPSYVSEQDGDVSGVYGTNNQQMGDIYSYHTDPSADEGLSYGKDTDTETQGSDELLSSIRAPNAVIQSFLENKLKEEMETQKNAVKKKELSELITLLRQAYIQELVESLQGDSPERDGSRTLPGFAPLPSEYVPNATTAKPGTPSVGTKLSEVKSPVNSNEGKSIGRNVKQPLEPFNSGVTRGRNYGRLPPGKRLQQPILLNKRTGGFDPSYMRSRRQTPVPGVDQATLGVQALSSFAEDIKKFFLLVSVLDQDKCLQKLVCEVHTKTGDDVAKLSAYESNILVTFKVMNILMPANAEDSTTLYRAAAKIGELSKSEEVCKRTYTSCTFNSTDIVKMGNQVAATGDADAPATTAAPMATEPAASSDAVGSESGSVPNYALPPVMPQV